MTIREKSILLFQKFAHSPYCTLVFSLLGALLLLKTLLFFAGGSFINLFALGGTILLIIELIKKTWPFLLGLSLIIFLFWFLN
ncbi:hypothetical protein QJV37_14265 [Listeria cossartiae subsp. cayugensis]|uniref:Uncharacterized protein n=1 Tax=Listeria cossartiae subsp. cayugensis TaxID=2713505 RepID=A0ABU2ISB1_9LIST|nr:hypothetical protein [Listeria cossartiae]MDT0115297.1 hypothetical protein [Listeria cossartiae subsp. cayugensis]